MFKKSQILLAGAACLLTLSACNDKGAAKGKEPATAKESIAATVNGTTINQNRVELLAKQRSSQGQPDSPEARKEIVDHLALQLALAQEAGKKGLDKNPDVIDQLDLTKQSILANAYVQDYLTTHPVTDEMLKAEYEKAKTQMAGTEYKARHILVEKESDAKDIITKLKKSPKVFEALAKEQSKDTGSKVNGGDLGWFDARGMVPEFGAAVAKLEKSKFTEEPIKTQFGYHVILLEDSRVKQAPPFEQVKAGLTQQAQQQSLKKFLDDTKSKAKIEIAQTPAAPAAPMPVATPGPKPAEAAKP